MDQPQQLYPQLYSTSGHRSNSESSEGREDYFYNPEVVRPGDNVIPDLRHFVKTPKILTREGRDQLRNLRSNVGGPYGQRRATRLAENPDTPKQSVKRKLISLAHRKKENLYRNYLVGCRHPTANTK